MNFVPNMGCSESKCDGHNVKDMPSRFRKLGDSIGIGISEIIAICFRLTPMQKVTSKHCHISANHIFFS
jgi:hypothetical protein